MTTLKSTPRQRKLTKELFEIESRLLYGQKKPERIAEIEKELIKDGLMQEDGAFKLTVPHGILEIMEQYM